MAMQCLLQVELSWHSLLTTTVAHLPHTHNLRRERRREDMKSSNAIAICTCVCVYVCMYVCMYVCVQLHIPYSALPPSQEGGVISNGCTQYPPLMQTLKDRDDLEKKNSVLVLIHITSGCSKGPIVHIHSGTIKHTLGHFEVS